MIVYTNQLIDFNYQPDSKANLQSLGANKTDRKLSDGLFEESLSICSKKTASCSSLDTIFDNSDIISTHSNDNLDESITILNSTQKQRKKNPTDETKYKTENCKNWSETLQCPYGKRCKFAHGKQELNDKKILKSSYKLKKCNSFHNRMLCPYGVRCLFAHEQRPIQEIASPIMQKFISCPDLLSGSNIYIRFYRRQSRI